MALQSRSAGDTTHHVRRCLLLLALALMVTSQAFAQGTGGIVDAVLALRQAAGGNSPVQRFGGRVYGGRITNTTITNGANDPDPLNFGGDDTIDFTIEPRSGGRAPVRCSGTRAEFDACVRANAGPLLDILFPRSLSEDLTGRDAAQNHAQQFLLTTALDMAATPETGQIRRPQTGGRLEHEWFERDGRQNGDSGSAWQGLYQFPGSHISLEGRYTHQREDIDTHATTIAADYHPFVEINPALQWRVGADARSGVLYSRSNAFDFGSLDFGGGVWTSARKDFSRVRVGGGSLFQGSKSVIPSSLVGDDARFITDAIGERGIAYDLSYGTVVGFLMSDRTSLNAKALETRAINSDRAQPPARLFLVSVAYLLRGHTPVDVGYRVSRGGGLNAHSVFAQGNFRW